MSVPLKEWRESVSWLRGLPAGWRVARFKGIASLSTVDNSAHDDRLLSLSTSRGIVPKEYDDENRVRSGEDLQRYWSVRPGHLVVNPMWLAHGSIAASNIEGVISPDYRVYETARFMDPGYTAMLLRTKEYRGIYDLFVRGNTTYDRRVSKDDFHCIPVVVPPLELQRTIATFLDRKTTALDALIAKKEHLLDLLKEKRQALFAHVVTKGLDASASMKPSGDAWLGLVPAHWTLRKLGWIAQVGNGSTPSREHPEYWAESERHGYPWLNSAKVNADTALDADRFVSPTAMRECHLPRVNPGSVLVAITGEGQTRGRAALLMFPATVSQHIAYISLRTSSLNPTFLHRHLQARYEWMRGESSGGGSTKAALTCEFLRSLRVAIPPAEEQERISQRIEEGLSSNDRLAQQTERSLYLLREYRQALITAAVTGKIDVSKEAA